MSDSTDWKSMDEWYRDDPKSLADDTRRHMVSTLGRDYGRAGDFTKYQALAHVLKDRLVHNWIKTQRSYYDKDSKRVYYLSLEFLMGRSLRNNIFNLQLEDRIPEACQEVGANLEELEELEPDAGLGNGGLGRLAACYLDSMATKGIPGFGYGIRYEYGIFNQAVQDGYQVEMPDNWLHYGNPWEFKRMGFMYLVHLYGRVDEFTDESGEARYKWEDTAKVMAMPCDMMIPGYGNGNVVNLRLWAAKPGTRFNLSMFNSGDYIRSMEDTVRTETISKVLYPDDSVSQGRALRLVQEYFFVSATMQDILRRFMKLDLPFSRLPDKVAVQLNETHAAIAIPELMRLLLDEHKLTWDEAFDICVKVFAYTNHTVMPEALERWPVDMLGKILPRHLQIIYEINRRFLDQVAAKFPGDADRVSRMSIIDEYPVKQVCMAKLALVGGHAVNGVSALHSRIIKESLFKDFHDMFPTKFVNVTNGVTPRRWLDQCNRPLSRLITSYLGPNWVTDLEQLGSLTRMASDGAFLEKWKQAKAENKKTFCAYAKKFHGLDMDPEWMFDVQVKRIHEYKRQLLNVLHTVALYNRIKAGTHEPVPRVKIFAGKAAPGYYLAKMIIKLINSVAQVVNNDPETKDRLQVVFLPNYGVSMAEVLIPATDLSEQISLAGTEASGTGNMKFALNGAVTIGTWDGANIEIFERVGEGNYFPFGLSVQDAANLRASGYDPGKINETDKELKQAVTMIGMGYFSGGDSSLFRPVLDAIFQNQDRYMNLADFRSYADCQDRVDRAYADYEQWTVKSLMNTAHMGYFSSDRAVSEYAEKIWNMPVSQW